MEGLTAFQRGVLAGLEAANWNVGITSVDTPADLLDGAPAYVDPFHKRRFREGLEYGFGLHGVVMRSLDAKFAAEEQRRRGNKRPGLHRGIRARRTPMRSCEATRERPGVSCRMETAMKGAQIHVDPQRIVVALRENAEAHSELDQYEVPAGTLRERIQAATAALDKSRTALIARCEELEWALGEIAKPKRPDGTYNLSREACERIAKEALDG